ncbi:MAG TPA: DUF748 domain-containing protein [Anaeromyxobacteraceae bacterium]|nr:DUF748 domain-containing protein [Anaeromyxobacteraceae bacterium]
MRRRPRSRRTTWLRRLAIFAVAFVALGVAIHFAIDPIATWRTRVALNDTQNYRGRFIDVDVSLHDLSYTIRGLRIEKLSAGGSALPFFEAERVDVGVYWRELLHGNLVAAIRLLRPKLNLVAAEQKRERQLEESGKVGFQVAELAPVRLDRVEVQEGQVLFVDATAKERPELWLHGVEATLENFATRKALGEGQPTVLALRGVLQRSGKVTLFATMDPLAKSLTFSGQARLEGLKLVELGELLVAKTGINAKGGTMDMSARFVAENGAIRGGVRPVLKNPEVGQGKPGLWEKLKAGLVDISLDLFSDDIPGRDGVATTIPIRGEVDAPQAQAVPTILGIVRNAFVTGLADSLANLPLPQASKPEGVVRQARRALSRDEGPPRAQPKEER